jgi:hypothetical protein
MVSRRSPTVISPRSSTSLPTIIADTKLGHLVEAVVDGIGADAFRYLGQFGQILRNLLRTDDQRRIMRRLIAPERRIGDALQLRGVIDRRARQRHRRGEPPPHRGNDAQRYEEKRQRRAKADRPAPKSMNIFAYLAVRDSPVDPPTGMATRAIAPGHRSGDISLLQTRSIKSEPCFAQD